MSRRSPDGFRAGAENTVGQGKIFVDRNAEHIAQHFLMPRISGQAVIAKKCDIHKKDPTVTCRYDIHHHRFVA